MKVHDISDSERVLSPYTGSFCGPSLGLENLSRGEFPGLSRTQYVLPAQAELLSFSTYWSKPRYPIIFGLCSLCLSFAQGQPTVSRKEWRKGGRGGAAVNPSEVEVRTHRSAAHRQVLKETCSPSSMLAPSRGIRESRWFGP